MSHTIKVSKLDVARRQLEQAIFLFFNDGDPIAIHTLVAAAYNIIRDLNIKTNADGKMIKTKLVNEAKESERKRIRDKISEAENFFKHADRDPEALLNFNPAMTGLLLYDATQHLKALTGKDSAYFKVYNAWVIVMNIGVAGVPSDLKNRVLADAPAALSMGRQAFFKQVFYALKDTNA